MTSRERRCDWLSLGAVALAVFLPGWGWAGATFLDNFPVTPDAFTDWPLRNAFQCHPGGGGDAALVRSTPASRAGRN